MAAATTDASTGQDGNGEHNQGQNNNPDLEVHVHGMRTRDTWRVQKFHVRANVVESDGTIRIPIVVKADADGSLSAIRDSLVSMGEESRHKVVIEPIMEGIGCQVVLYF